jgi:recombinational DNA repair protein (RecF pathway)
MNCARCGREIQETESYQHLGQTLCEDCYIDMRNPPKACDPWAVYSATRLRQSQGNTGSEGLTEIQKTLYEFIREKRKVTREELIHHFNLKEIELQTHLAILRHCELVKGHKEGDRVYLVPFS